MRMSQRCLRKCQQRQERREKGISTTKWLTLLVFLFALALLAPWRAARWGERKAVLLSEDVVDVLTQHDPRWEHVSRVDVALSLRDLWYMRAALHSPLFFRFAYPACTKASVTTPHVARLILFFCFFSALNP